MSLSNRLIDPAELRTLAAGGDLVIVDLRKPEEYAAAHIPGAVFLDRAAIVAKQAPVGGLLPSTEVLVQLLGAAGICADSVIIAYDEEGGGWAGRLMWTLDSLGHASSALLDGGWAAWQAESYPVETGARSLPATQYRAGRNDDVVAQTDYILSRLGASDLALLDTRTPEEFSGEKRLASRGGRIPGAVNMNWVEAMDASRALRLKPVAELRSMLAALGVTPDKEVVVYCQTHHRSSHTYVMLKHLGYERVRGYPGAWSDWGNRTDTPVET